MPTAPNAVVGLALALHSAPGRFAILLGSGISQSAGIPTGWAVVGDIASKVAAVEGVDPAPADPVAWYAAKFGASPDYSGLLEAVAPTPAQRRDLLAAYFEPSQQEKEGGQKVPTRAHRAVARLVARGAVRVVVTTNFDRLLEQALEAEGVQPVVVAGPAAAMGTTPLAHTRCTVIKVHGDYLDPDIKNTVGELDTYEPALDALLDRAFDDYGLIVCGWSGTWDKALRHAIERAPSRRYATYWASHGVPTPEADRMIQGRDGLVMPIESADEFFESLLSKVEALDSLAASPRDLDVVVAEAKRFLPDPVHRISLHDLVMGGVDEALHSVTYGGHPSDPTYGGYLTQVHDIEAASARAVAALGVVARFGDREGHLGLVEQALRRLAAPLARQESGLTLWLYLRGYPALLALYAVTISAAAGENWELLAQSLAAPVPARLLGGESHSPIGHEVKAFAVLDSEAIASSFPGEGRRKTPLSDHLHNLMVQTLSDSLHMSDDEFSNLFDQVEYLLGVVAHDGPGNGPVGRFAWRRASMLNGPFPDQCLTAATPALLARGLFSGDDDRLAEIVGLYDQSASGGRFW